jgi:hypothetical protein
MLSRWLAALALLLLAASPAVSQSNVIVNYKSSTTAATQVSPTNPLPVTGLFSATTTGFAPGGSYATVTATASSADVALPTGAVVAAFNTGTSAVSCVLAVGAGTATASKNIIQPGGWFAFTVGSNTHIACINQAGDTVSNVVVLSGGDGLPTGAGGGSGGANVVSVTNSLALGAANTLTIPISNGQNVIGFGITNLSATGAVLTLEASDDNGATWVAANCVFASSGTLAGTVSANNSCRANVAGRTNIRWRVSTTGSGTANIAYDISTAAGITSLSVPLPQGTNNIGSVSVPTWAGGTLGAMANYGTSPGAVLVPGVNAYVTNTNANGQAVMASSSPVVLPSNMPDPCFTAAKTNVPISVTGTTTVKLVSLQSSMKIYICSLSLISAGASSVNIFDGTNSTTECNANQEAVIGAGAAAGVGGLSLAANGGLTLGAGGGTVALTNTAAHDLCISQSGAGIVAGHITYVQRVP